jgi:predicted DNA-binding antitoxin AbrB/MazE fold protein
VAYRDGTFVPLAEVDYVEGSTLTITVHENAPEEKARPEQPVRSARGAWKGLVDPDEAISRMREQRLVRTRPEPDM